MGGGGSQTSTQKADPWAGQQPYLTYGFEQAKSNYNSGGPSYYSGSTVADPSAVTTMAQGLQTNRALASNRLNDATINGSFLNGNPYLDANFQAGADSITKAYDNAVNGQRSGFAAGNRNGSGMEAYYKNQENDTLAKNLGNLYGQTYYTNYNNERANQINAANNFTDLNALGEVGAAQDTHNQDIINANIDRWNYNQNLANDKLANYMNLIQGNYGQSSTTTQKAAGGSGIGNALGTALAISSFF